MLQAVALEDSAAAFKNEGGASHIQQVCPTAGKASNGSVHDDLEPSPPPHTHNTRELAPAAVEAKGRS